MLERSVRDMGGQIAAMDTDSAMIVSTKDGGLAPCAGGPERLENYHEGSGNAALERDTLLGLLRAGVLGTGSGRSWG